MEEYIGKEIYEEKHKNLEAKVLEQGNCLCELQKIVSELKEQTAIMQSMWKSSTERLIIVEKQTEEMRMKPAKRYDLFSTSIIQYILLAGIAALLYLK